MADTLEANMEEAVGNWKSFEPDDGKSRPHWPLLFIPNVNTSPSLVRATTWALPMATCTICWPLSSMTCPDQSHWDESFPNK